MSALVQKGSAQGRPMALAVTVAVHAALVAGLLAMKVVEVSQDKAPVIHLQHLDSKRRPDPPMTPIEPVLGTPTMPHPEVQPARFSEEAIEAEVVESASEVIATEPARGLEAIAVPVSATPLRYQAVRPSDDYYPPQAIRRGIEGAAIVRACVDAQGRLSGTPAVVKSSREPMLDGAALKWAGEALRFQPATRGGVGIAACKEFRVSFTLH